MDMCINKYLFEWTFGLKYYNNYDTIYSDYEYVACVSECVFQ